MPINQKHLLSTDSSFGYFKGQLQKECIIGYIIIFDANIYCSQIQIPCYCAIAILRRFKARYLFSGYNSSKYIVSGLELI